MVTRVSLDAIGLIVAALTAPESGGLSLVAWADVVYNAADAMVMAGDDYDWATSGEGQFSQDFRTLWGLYGLYSVGSTGISIANLIGSTTRISIHNIPKVYQWLKYNAPHDIPSFKFRIQQSIQLVDAKILDISDALQLQGIKNHLIATYEAIRFAESRRLNPATNTYGFLVRSDDLALMIRQNDNLPVRACDGEYVNGEFTLTPTTDEFDLGSNPILIEQADGIPIRNAEGNRVIANIEVYASPSGRPYRFKIAESLDPNSLQYRFPEFHQLCQAKAWGELDNIISDQTALTLTAMGDNRVNWLALFATFDNGPEGLSRLNSILDQLDNNVPLAQQFAPLEGGPLVFNVYDKLDGISNKNAYVDQLSTNTSNAATYANRLTQLDDTDGGFIRLADDMGNPTYRTTIIDEPNLIPAYNVLQAFKNTRRNINNLRALDEVHPYFQYAGLEGYNGLINLFEGGQYFGKQRILDNFALLMERSELSPSPDYKVSVDPSLTFATITTTDKVILTVNEGKLTYLQFEAEGSIVPVTQVEGWQMKKNGTKIGFSVADPNAKVLGISFTDFIGSVDNFEINTNGAHQAFEIYGRLPESAPELFDLFVVNEYNEFGSTIWPPARGGYNFEEPVPLEVGMRFDRYQSRDSGLEPLTSGQEFPRCGGEFTSPLPEAGPYPFPSRALNQDRPACFLKYTITVKEAGLPYSTETATIIPWFGLVGNGKQTKFTLPKIEITPPGGSPIQIPTPWTVLANSGKFEVEITAAPEGTYSLFVGKKLFNNVVTD
jgi:hypothetical protein